MAPRTLSRGGSVQLCVLPGSQVIRLRDRVAYDFPAQLTTHLSQPASIVMPEDDDIAGLECYDKIRTVAADRYLSPPRDEVASEGLNGIKH
jgi:hypothetical protein